MSADVSRLKDITVLYCEDEQSLREVTSGILKSFTKNRKSYRLHTYSQSKGLKHVNVQQHVCQAKNWTIRAQTFPFTVQNRGVFSFVQRGREHTKS